MRITDTFLQDLKYRLSIEDVISSYVQLKKSGRTHFGLCPFHNEKTPSFAVFTESQTFHCFGCGAGGDIISFIMKIENLDYLEAVKFLAETAGMTVPENDMDDSIARKKSRLMAANREAARFFNSNLKTAKGEKGYRYFKDRGFSDSTITKFGLGYALDEWDGLIKYMKGLGYSVGELYEANLVRKSEKNGKTHYYDNFKNRIIIPIIDLRGNVIAFGGRVLDDSKPKYVNTSDTLIYKKSNAVFALNKAKNNPDRKIILAEGYMDVIAMHQAGFTNAVACLGTALTREQARMISRYADEVILSYDSDGAGKAATDKAIQIFGEVDIKVRVLSLTGGKDPDEIIKTHGRERFEALINGASNDIEFRLLAARKNFDMQTTDGKLGFLNQAVKILSSVDNAIERDLYISRLSEELSVSKEAIKIQVAEEIKKNRRRQSRENFRNIQKQTAGYNDKINPDRAKYLRAAKAEEIILSTVLKNQDLAEKIFTFVNDDLFITELNRRIFLFIKENMKDGKGIDLSIFNEAFDFEEMGYITDLFRGENISNSVQECRDCAEVIGEEKTKLIDVNPSEISDEDFLNLFKK